MKMSRTVIALSLLGMVAHPVCAALSFEETARQVIIAFQQRDNAKINALIDKKVGMYVLYRIGAGFDYEWMSKFDINQPIPGFNYMLGSVLNELSALVKRKPALGDYVVEHIGEILGVKDVEKVRDYSASHCQIDSKDLCKKLHNAAVYILPYMSS
ncbi:putative exported protein [Salmonella enterica]|nr:putative exported protein [Salmonella enterica]